MDFFRGTLSSNFPGGFPGFSPIDEEMGAIGECEDICGSDEQTDAQC